jgi:hypothetical protein
VTLISACRTKFGIVVHADSQETIGDYRVQVKKIKSEKMGDFDVIVAGSGQPGSLIDSFSPYLFGKITNGVSSIYDFAATTEQTLEEFYKCDVQLCPDPNKIIKFLIVASHPKSGQYQAWTTENIRLRPIPDDEPLLLGWDEPLYKNIAKRLYSHDTTIAQAVLAGVYLFTIAEGTSQYVRSPFSIAVITGKSIWMEEEKYVSEITSRLSEYERQINRIFLSCADTSVPVYELKKTLNQFSETALALHREQIDSNVKEVTLQQLMGPDVANPRYPADAPIAFTNSGWQIEHDPEEIRRKNDEFRKNTADARQSKPSKIVQVSINQQGGVEYQQEILDTDKDGDKNDI